MPSREYYLTHREELLERQRLYREAHREDARAYARERYWANVATERAHSRAWQAANRERASASRQDWKTRNPEKVQAAVRRRALAKKGLREFHTDWEWEVMLLIHGGQCVVCGTTEKITKDHIIPISKGGSDLIENIQPMCQSHNSQKHARI